MNANLPLRLSRGKPDGALARSMQSLKLRDGRQLGYALFGPDTAFPVFYFHGWPGSRLEAGFFNVPGVQMIGVDRPGYGLSDPLRKRRLADWPGDVAQLADRLGHEKFAIVGMSGGGPYAAMCAHALKDRLSRVAIIAGLGPPDAPGMSKSRVGFLLDIGQRPMTSAVLSNVMRVVIRDRRAEQHIERIRRRVKRSTKDHEAMTPDFLQMLVMSFREGLRSSAKGPSSDARIYGEPWPFALRDIRVPVRVWHGGADMQVPVSIGQHYAKNIPGAVGHFPADEGHVSIVTNYIEAIITDLRRP
jgi:pimeloyl-ACP methyl ester carboxylesterase